MKTQTAVPEVLDYPTSTVNTIDIRIDKKEFQILTEDCSCIIDEVEFVKIIDLETKMQLPVVAAPQPTTTATPRKGMPKFLSRILNRLSVLPLTLSLCLVLVLGVGNVWGQAILTFEFSALAGNEATANSNFNNSGLTSSAISRGAGLTASNNSQRFNATSWATSSIANAVSGNDYMEFTITPNSGKQFSVSSIVVQWQRSSTGNTQIALRSSVDNYTSDLDAVKSVTDNTTTQTFTWTFAQANSSTAVTYRFYSYAESTGGSGGPGDGTGDDITVNGSVSDVVTAPTAPTITSITPGNQELSVAFTAGSDGGSAITNYKYSTDNGGSYTAVSPASTTSPIVITGLTNGTSYNVKIRAVNAIGDGTESNMLSGTPTTGVSVPVLGSPTATAITTTSATLGATVSSDGGASLTARGTVWGTTASPTGNSLAEGGTAVEAFTHSRIGLTANTLYYYRGYATNSAGTGYSADGTFTTLHNAPTVGSGSGATVSAITANWTAPTGGGSASFTYEVQISTASDFSVSPTTQSGISSATLSYQLTGLAENTTYYFRVRANNAGGSSAWSSASIGYATLANSISLTSLGSAATEDFNTLASSGTSSTTPIGWYFSEANGSANTTYTAGTGSSSTGDTYSFGNSSDRAFGGLQSGSLVPTIGAKLINNTGSSIVHLLISYTGETWRVGGADRADRLDFQFSTDATSLSTGTWTDVNNLDYVNVGQATGSGSIQHSTSISELISGLNIANGSTFWIRWTDFNASGADDGMGVDDFSITPFTHSTNYYRTKQSGYWFDEETWESSSDNINWESATVPPSSEVANSLVIAAGHTVTLEKNITVDQLQINETGQFTISNGNTLTINNGTGTDCTINGILLNNGNVVRGSSATFVVNNGGNFIQNTTSANEISNTLDLTTFNSGSTMTFRGSSSMTPAISLSNRTFHHLIFESTSGTMNVDNVTGSYPCTVNGNLTIGNTISGIDGGVILDFDQTTDYTGSIDINGNLTISSSSTFETSPSQMLNLTGNLSNSGTINLGATSTFVLDGSTPQTISSSSSLNFNNLTINNSNGISSNFSPTVNGTITLTSGTLTVGANTLTLNGSIGRASGNIDVNNASSTIVFGGSTAQTIPASTFTGNINNLTLNNSAGLSIKQDISVVNSLTLTSGKLTLGANHLTLGLNATIGGSPFSASNMIIASGDGELRKRFTEGSGDIASFTFPVGNGGGVAEYTPIVLDFASGNYGANAYVSVRVKDSKQATLNSSVTNYLNRNWIVEPNDITGYSYKIQLHYVDADFVTDGSLAEGNLLPIKISSGQWYQPVDGTFSNAQPQGFAGVFTNDNYLEWNGLTTFSEFGGAGGSNQPLPVELLFFNASCVEDQNVLSWQTASEHNSSHFDIEKSRDGQTWNVIGQQTAAGNSTELLNYQFVDADKNNATVYYRLNQVDVDGKNEYFGPVALDCDQNSFEVSTLPNPSNGNFLIKIQSNEIYSAELKLVDLKGNVLFTNVIMIQEGINVYPITHILQSGMYFIHIQNSKDQKITVLKHLQN